MMRCTDERQLFYGKQKMLRCDDSGGLSCAEDEKSIYGKLFECSFKRGRDRLKQTQVHAHVRCCKFREPQRIQIREVSCMISRCNSPLQCMNLRSISSTECISNSPEKFWVVATFTMCRQYRNIR